MEYEVGATQAKQAGRSSSAMCGHMLQWSLLLHLIHLVASCLSSVLCCCDHQGLEFAGCQGSLSSIGAHRTP